MRSVSKYEMWSEKCDSDLSFAENFLRRFVLVIMLDHLIVRFFWLFSLIFDEWRMLILDIEWRMSVLDLSSDVYDEMSLNLTKATHQTWWMKTSSHQIWRKRFIKLDERNVISSSRTSASFHQTFWKERQFFYFLMSNLLQRHLIWKT